MKIPGHDSRHAKAVHHAAVVGQGASVMTSLREVAPNGPFVLGRPVEPGGRKSAPG
jgi:hypothetical protein